MDYPLQLSFKILTLGNQIFVNDAGGALLLYARQKKFKLKEAIRIFADEAQTRLLYTIDADRVFDFSARYRIAEANGTPIGAISRRGARSLWKAHYDVWSGDHATMTITEEKPLIKLIDGLLAEVPFVGMISGYFLHPSYVAGRLDGTPVLRLKKQPAFLESRFTIDKLAELDGAEELRALLGLVMVVLFERERG